MARLDIQPIQSLDDPELQPYLTLRRPLDHHQKRIVVAEGETVVRRLAQSNLTILSSLITPDRRKSVVPLLENRPEKIIRIYEAEKKLLENLTGFTFFQGILAVGKLPPPISLETLLHSSAAPRLLVAFDGLANAENIGGLVRSCAAFGVHGLIVGETASSPYLRRAVRGSWGTIFKIPVFESENLAGTIRELRAQMFHCVAAHPHPGGKTLPETNLAEDCCIVFGSEGHGVSPRVLEACDEWAAIPMPPEVESLNVGNAGAIFLYEANRQRGRSAGCRPLPCENRVGGKA
jgi:tRNA G18 (ribose-2'-O)-methylase SpoU